MSNLSKNLSIASKKTYESSCTTLILWLIDNKPNLVPDNYKQELEKHIKDKRDKREFIKSTIFREHGIPPIDFSQFTAEDVTTWFSSVRRPNGDWFGHSSYSNHKSAVFHLFKNYGIKITPEFDREIRDCMAKIPKDNYPSSGGNTPKSDSKKRKWQHEAATAVGTVELMSPGSLVSPLLTKRVKKDRASSDNSSKEAKEVRRLAARTLLAEMREFVGEEKYIRVGELLTDYHKALSSIKISTPSDNTVDTLKSQIFYLLNRNDNLYMKFVDFLPQKYRGAV